ncbi:hypothetical protein MT962_000023 [Franconibacter sp. IITDAS19]|uniref:hypothetical protein n=1 Tax=Franconibacter sp. IITDAS19 TaxID=2930569 RepID=UPI001FF836D1|nr:hypothetical protein [Franconibacter sp. IITDAS19]MCK1970557.1 hypothetical protein [Franconibacter sp. IITDAS19]
MDDDFLENDLDWFLSGQDGFLAHFATGGKSPVPEKIRESIDNYELVYDYFYSLEPLSDVEVIEYNLPDFSDEEQRSRYLKSFIEMSRKGLFSYDYRNDKYKLISKPLSPLRYSVLPDDIKGIIYISSENIS